MKIRIYGVPEACARPRRGRYGNWYSPTKSSAWYRAVMTMLGLNQSKKTLEGPLIVRMAFFLPRPKRMKAAASWCITRPDCDNLAKQIMDCMEQTGWFKNDSQIVDLHVSKVYEAALSAPGVFIEIEELDKNVKDM